MIVRQRRYWLDGILLRLVLPVLHRSRLRCLLRVPLWHPGIR